MKVVKHCIWVSLAVLMIPSCKRELKSADYVHYIQQPKNGLRKTMKIANWQYDIQYKPYDYVVLLENKGRKNEKAARVRANKLKGTAWFNLSIRLADGSISPLRYNLQSREEYDQRLNYFLNEAVKEIKLIYDNRDTLRPISYLFENNYNLTPQETIVVGFALPIGVDRPEKDMQLSYNDRVYKNGIIKTKYRAEDINNIPALIY